MSDALLNIDKLYRQLIKEIGSNTNRRLIASKAAKIIYNRTKSGYGVNKEGLDPDQTKRQRLKPLSPGYVQQRRGKVAFRKSKYGHTYPLKKGFEKPKLGKFGSPARSNLTFSGQMLEALGFKVSGGNIFIRVKATRRPGEDLNNRELSEIVSEERPWLSLTRTEWRILKKDIEAMATKAIKKIFK